MTCPKCKGPTSFDASDEAPAGVTEWRKCPACGKRWDPTRQDAVQEDLKTIQRAFDEYESGDDDAGLLRDDDEERDRSIEIGDGEELDLEPEAEPERPIDLAMRDVRIKRERTQREPRTTKEAAVGKWSPEARAAHKKRMQDIWAAKRKGGGTNAVVPAKPTALTAKPARLIEARGDVLTAIDEALERVRDDLHALERAKEILSRG